MQSVVNAVVQADVYFWSEYNDIILMSRKLVHVQYAILTSRLANACTSNRSTPNKGKWPKPRSLPVTQREQRG